MSPMLSSSEDYQPVTPGCYGPDMEPIWPAIGFLFGITLWMPFIIGSRTDAKLARLEGRIRADLIRSMQQDRSS
jgi:hypothetical protein